MIEFALLSGPDRGTTLRPGSGPVRVGRAPGMEARVAGPGVFDHHFDVVPSDDGGFALRVAGSAKVMVDGQYVDQAPLRNGMVLECGGVRIRFGITPPTQRPLEARERIVWLGLGVVLACELAVLAWVGH